MSAVAIQWRKICGENHLNFTFDIVGFHCHFQQIFFKIPSMPGNETHANIYANIRQNLRQVKVNDF